MTSKTRKPVAYYCSFCGKNQNQVKRLIAGPGGVYVCNECSVTFSRKDQPAPEKQGQRCSFCGKQQTPKLPIISGPYGVCICQECVNLCVEIITEEESSWIGEPK